MTNLTIHLVVKNHEQTIGRTFESIKPLGGKIIVADIGCRDGTVGICKRYGADVVRLSLNDDYSQVRNFLAAKKGWVLWLEPWETILRGSDTILSALKEEAAYRLHVLQEGTVTKQVRLWHSSLGLKFVNPVYETVVAEAADLSVYLHSTGDTPDVSLIQKWAERCPLATEPLYYQACSLLVRKKWKEFLTAADHYIFQEKGPKMSLTMTQYYCAMVHCYVTKNFQAAVNYLLPCLAERPTMAEFWCLLGDIYYAGKLYEKAAIFYDNAAVLGSRRLKDLWPLEVAKYKEYPATMSAACRTAMESVKSYVGRK